MLLHTMFERNIRRIFNNAFGWKIIFLHLIFDVLADSLSLKKSSMVPTPTVVVLCGEISPPTEHSLTPLRM